MKWIQNQLIKNKRVEDRVLRKKKGVIKSNLEPVLDNLEKRIPKKVEEKINLLFEKAFYMVFEKGTSIIEKTYSKEKIQIEHIVSDFMMDGAPSRSVIKRMDKPAKKSRRWGKRIALLEGLGLGFLGIGLPDIPIFTGVLLKGIYEIAWSYGFNYNLYEEQIYILKLIRAALATDTQRLILSDELDRYGRTIDSQKWHGSLDSEIKTTAKSLSQELLVAKFIQGLPVVGVAGAIFNHSTYKKISDYALVKYKKRFYEKKQQKKTSIEVL
ncbi:MAG: EcsC family protein [Peptostreptococcaceae bacterium]|nr:EcsC family protein [Peptostreptococcaceae bacterium]